MYNIGFYFTIDHMPIFWVISEGTSLWLIYLPIHWNCNLLNSTNFNFIYKKAISFTPLFSTHQLHYWIDSSESEKKKKKNSWGSSYSNLSRQNTEQRKTALFERACPSSRSSLERDPLYRFPTAADLVFLWKVIIWVLILHCMCSENFNLF